MRVSLSSAALVIALAASLAARGDSCPQAPQPAPEQQKPVFRTEVNFVRVDAYPRANGLPVADLQAEDFQILEDGAAQKVAFFEHIVIRAGTAPSERVDPRNVRESNQMAGDPRNRLFVLFLDTFHVTDPAARHDNRLRRPGSTGGRLPAESRMGPPSFVDRALANFLTGTIGPDDLVAAMTPEMDPGELTFIRRPESIETFLKTAWARRFSLDNLDPVQESYFSCYPPDDLQHRFDGVAEEMVVRQREFLSIQALRGLVRRLGELREERKGVLLVSEGWALFRPNRGLARQFEGLPPPQPPGVYVGPGGKPASGTDPRTVVSHDWQRCEADRVRLANQDDAREFLDVLDEANRANASFYAIDPRGLAVFDTPIDYREINTPKGTDQAQVGRPGVIEDAARLRERLETLRTAASATDGLAMVNSNDLTASLKRIVDDLSDYYLLGYYSTNAKTDGTFRRVEVRVKRPGVEVRTRRGYRAATTAEVAARKLAAARPDPDVAIRESALAALDRMKVDRAARCMGGYAWDAAPDGTGAPRPVLWVTVELDGAAARSPEWRGGGLASVAAMTPDGQTLRSEEAPVSAAARSFVRYLPAPGIGAGEYAVRVRVRGEPGSTADFTEQLRITIPPLAAGAAAPPGQPILFRRGPFTGPAFQPTADIRFRRSERIRVDVAIDAADVSLSARLLDRKGQPLAVPVTAAAGEQGARRFATAELALAPLGPADYLIELTVRRAQRTDKVLAPFRIVP
jgi:VWFA-related protein